MLRYLPDLAEAKPAVVRLNINVLRIACTRPNMLKEEGLGYRKLPDNGYEAESVRNRLQMNMDRATR